MFDLINFKSIFIPIIIGITIFTLIGLFFYLYRKYIIKNKDISIDELFNDESNVIPPTRNSKTIKDKKKKIEKEENIILKHYAKQLKNGEISIEEYNIYIAEIKKTSELEKSNLDNNKKNIENTENELIEEELTEDFIDIESLFNESEERLSVLLLEYYHNTSKLYTLQDISFDNEDFQNVLNEKVYLLDEILYVVNHNIEFIGNEVEGLLENRYELKTLIQLEMNNINSLLNNEDITTLNFYFLEDYVVLYNQDYFYNNK